MDQSVDRPPSPSVFHAIGLWAVIAGAIAVALVFVQIGVPSLETRPSVGTQIGEIAGDIKKSAIRSLFGLKQPEPEIISPKPIDYLAIIAPVLAALAIVLGVVSAVKRENRRFAFYGIGLAATALTLQYLWWMALLIVGAFIIVAILENIGDIFSF